MGKMKIEHPHSFEQAEARERLTAMGDYLKKQAGIDVTWKDDQNASFAGKYGPLTFDGAVTIQPKKVEFEGKDPGFLLRGQAEKYIKGKLAHYLDPSKTVAQLQQG